MYVTNSNNMSTTRKQSMVSHRKRCSDSSEYETTARPSKKRDDSESDEDNAELDERRKLRIYKRQNEHFMEGLELLEETDELDVPRIIRKAEYGKPVNVNMESRYSGKGKRPHGVSISKVKYQGKRYCVLKLHVSPPIFKVVDWHNASKVLLFKISASGDKNYATLLAKIGGGIKLTLHEFIFRYCSGLRCKVGQSIDHINVISHDEREVNHRAATSSEQNYNKDWKSRAVEIDGKKYVLPPYIQVHIDSKDRETKYTKHDIRFSIVINKINAKILCGKKIVNGVYDWQSSSTSSEKLSVDMKLKQAMLQLCKVAEAYPELGISKTEIYSVDEKNQSREEFNQILLRSGFNKQEIANCLVKPLAKITVPKISEDENAKIKVINQQKLLGKKRNQSALPPNCGVSESDIPKHMYFSAAGQGHRARFIIEWHPTQIKEYNRIIKRGGDGKGIRTQAFTGDNIKEIFKAAVKYHRKLEDGEYPGKVENARGGNARKKISDSELPDGVSAALMSKIKNYRWINEDGGYFILDSVFDKGGKPLESSRDSNITNRDKAKEIINMYHKSKRGQLVA